MYVKTIVQKIFNNDKTLEHSEMLKWLKFNFITSVYYKYKTRQKQPCSFYCKSLEYKTQRANIKFVISTQL